MSAVGGSAGICTDDDVLRGAIQHALEQANFAVRTTATAADAVATFADDPPDVLLLDIGLSDGDGHDVLQALRARAVATPVLFLAAGDAVGEQAAPRYAEGDDYLFKPFAVAELLVRVGCLTRSPGETLPGKHGTAHLDASARAIVAGDVRIDLTPTEFRLLVLLWDSRGQIVSRSRLVAAGWPAGAKVSSNTLDAYLARIRRKLRDAGAAEALQTRRGAGYELR